MAHGGGLLKHKEQPGATLFFEFGHNVARPKNFWRGVDPTQSRQTVKRRDMMQERPQPGHMPVPSGSWACSALVSDPRDEVMKFRGAPRVWWICHIPISGERWFWLVPGPGPLLALTVTGARDCFFMKFHNPSCTFHTFNYRIGPILP